MGNGIPRGGAREGPKPFCCIYSIAGTVTVTPASGLSCWSRVLGLDIWLPAAQLSW